MPAEVLASNSSFTVPYRTGVTTWSNTQAQGQDKVHKFKVNCGHPFEGHPLETDGPPVTCITSDNVSYALTYATPQTATGAIDLTVAGVTSGMTFTWTNAAGTVVGQTEDLTHVSAGVYCVEIKLDCCSFYDCVEVKDCSLSLTPAISQPASGTSNGSIALSMNNGTEPYQILWSNGATTNSIHGLAPGVYSVTVQDANHCMAIQSFTMLACPVIQVSAYPILGTPTSCQAEDGYIKMLSAPSASGGLSPYIFHWEDLSGNLLQTSIH